jgi:uncharacterized delta-60 repeat protein
MAGTAARMRSGKLLLLVPWILVVVLANPAHAAAGDLDPTFSDNGKVATNLTPSLDFASGVAVQADGRIVAVGRAGFAARWFGLIRYEPNGTLDASFGGDGKVTTNFTDGSDFATSVAIQTNGKIVAAGGADGRFGLARYRVDGTLDPGFGGDGKVITDFPNGQEGAVDLAIQADGKIVAAGVAQGGRFAVARYEPNGHLDASFSQNGRVTTGFEGFDLAFAHGVALRANGRIVVAGEVATPGRFALARYRGNGTLDLAFGGDGRITTNFGPGFDAALDVAIQGDGRVVAAGTTGEGSDPAFALARYEGHGSLDPTFAGDGRLVTQFPFGEDLAHGVAIQADGKIVAAGSSGEGGPFSQFALARYEPDGDLDPSFGTGGQVTTSFTEGYDFTIARDVAIQADGKIVAAGSVGGGGGRFGLARYLAA